MGDNTGKILETLLEIKGDLSTVKADTTHIKETAAKSERVQEDHGNRLRILENWRSWLAGAIAALGSAWGLFTWLG